MISTKAVAPYKLLRTDCDRSRSSLVWVDISAIFSTSEVIFFNMITDQLDDHQQELHHVDDLHVDSQCVCGICHLLHL